jgi:hypothetical protein
MSGGKDRGRAMKERNDLTRRAAVGITAGAALSLAAGERWIFAAQGGDVVKTPGDASAWRPVLLDAREAEGLARLVDALIPRTATPGARDARVHEYIDLAVSLAPVEEKKAFVDGFRWLDRRAKKTHGAGVDAIDSAQLGELLRSISDEHEDLPKSLAPGAAFFADLKRRTIFGYYTSVEGRVQELGLPDAVLLQTWRGCEHSGGGHSS